VRSSDSDLYAGTQEGADHIRMIADDGTQDFYERTAFFLREGLCLEENFVSLESKKFPNKFWRHHNYVLKLHDKSDGVFLLDSCFKLVPGLCNNQSISFQSKNLNMTHYIAKCDNELKMQTKENACGNLSNSGNLSNICWTLEENLLPTNVGSTSHIFSSSIITTTTTTMTSEAFPSTSLSSSSSVSSLEEVWSSWDQWSACSGESCGLGTRRRSRHCTIGQNECQIPQEIQNQFCEIPVTCPTEGKEK